MKLLLLVLAVSVGVSLSFRVHHHKRTRRDQASDEAADGRAVTCIQEQCKNDAIQFIQPFMLFQGGDPKAIIKNITGDEQQLTKICDGVTALLKCPGEKCTLTANMRAYIDANDVLHYVCEHKADIVRHSSCLIDAFTPEALQQSCMAAVMPLVAKFERSTEHYHTALRPSFSAGTSNAPSFTALKAALETLPELTCADVLPLVNCVANPAKEKCGEGAKTLIVEFIKEVTQHTRKFYETIAPGTHFLPDLDTCDAAGNAVDTFFKYFF